jgi:hypothetical protein
MRRLAAVFVILATAVAIAGCSPSSDNEVTGSVGMCSAKLYSPYNPRNLKQCIDVCVKCERGVVTTCSTACTLRGAQ